MSSGSALSIAQKQALDKGRADLHASLPLAPFREDPNKLLDQLREGKSVPQIANEIGVSKTHVYEFLLKHCPEEWQSISAAKSLIDVEECAEDLKDASKTPDKTDVARTSARSRLAQWRLEKENRKLYGEQKEQGGTLIQVIVDRGCGDTVTINGQTT